MNETKSCPGEPTVELRSFLTSAHLGVTTASEEHHSLQRKDFCLLELGSALLGLGMNS